MLVRVAIVSQQGPGLDTLAERLRLDHRLQVAAFTDLQAVRLALPTWPCQALVVRVDRLDEGKLEMARRLRAALPKHPLLFSAPKSDALALHKLSAIAGCSALDESRELEDAAKLVHKIAAGHEAKPRAHPRAKRHDPLEIRDAMGRSGTGRFLDFGPMGARVQVTSLGLSRRSRLTLSYASSAGDGRVHRVEASVAWVRPPMDIWDAVLSPLRITETLGLRFIAVST